MPRTKRLIPVDSAMHITCRGNNKQNVFQNSADKYCYYGLMRDLKEENHVKLFHYCLMDNHAHIILWLDEHTRLSRFMKQLNLSYYKYFEKSYGHCGHLFQSRFGGAVIDSERYLLQCGKYISLNPVRAGIVSRPEEYRFSSYNHYAYGKFDALITDDPLYVALSDSAEKRQESFIKYIIDEKVVNSHSLRKGTVLEASPIFKKYSC